MATRSRIGIQWPDGRIESVYCHFDGYLEHVGRTLHDCWRDEEQILELVALGDLSVLGKSLAACEAYHRDRGEELNITEHDGAEEFIEYAKSSWADYAYLHMAGQWWVYYADDWTPLATALTLTTH